MSLDSAVLFVYTKFHLYFDDFGWFLGGPLLRTLISLFIAAALTLPAFAQTQPADRSWIATSNRYANMLIEVVFKYRPEAGTQQGLSQFDTKVSQPTLANEDHRSGTRPRRCSPS